MNTPPTTVEFLALIEKSGLHSQEAVERALASAGLDRQSSLIDAARALVRDGLLTRFQAERLAEGRFRGFFIENYRILEILGAGGMGCLYLASDRQTGNKVALKVLSDKNKSDPGMTTRLALEALAGRKLSHPGIVRTYGMRRAEDVFGEVPYLVMEFVEGINLEELINLHGPISWPAACDIALQAARALDHAHSQGLVHRDVKPGNLLIDRKGMIRILDFGLALVDSRVEADEFSLAMIFGHDCLGTPDFISPEQSIDSYGVDARADVYSLGCTLYVAVTGRFPYPAPSSLEKIEGHRHQAAPGIRALNASLPIELERIVCKMMAKNPCERYQSMAEVARVLEPLASRAPVEFDFPRVLAARARLAKKRFSAHRGSTHVNDPLARTASPDVLASTSTRKLPRGAVDTPVDAEATSPEDVRAVPFADVGSRWLSSAEGPAASRTEAALVPLSGEPPIPLVPPRVIVGRESQCDVVLPYAAVSGKHCELRFDGQEWRIVDLQSKNGVQVNGKAVIDQVLRPGDRVSIARQYHYRVQHVPTAPLLGWYARLKNGIRGLMDS
jgi:serine/threonine-protein kinase